MSTQKIEKTKTTLISDKLAQFAKLNVERLKNHEARILDSIQSGKTPFIPVTQACTANNGGIIPWKTLVRFALPNRDPKIARYRKAAFKHWRENHLLTFIPAAGAASRYLSGVVKFVKEIEKEAPLLANITENIFNCADPINITPQDCKTLQYFFSQVKINPEMTSLSEKIRMEKSEQNKADFEELASYLRSLIEKGHAKYLTSYRKQKPDECQSEFKINDTEKPWFYLSNKSSSSRKIQKNDQQLTQIRNNSLVNNLNEEENISLSHIRLSESELVLLEAYAAAKIIVRQYVKLPKALVPTTLEGDSFLFLKLTEQIALFSSHKNALVVPANMSQLFENELNENRKRLISQFENIFDLEHTVFAPQWMKKKADTLLGSWDILEQGPELSTIRFNANGTPFINEQGQYSPVAAGHGELIHLFSELAEKNPSAECMHIRNIDNIIGTTEDRASELNVPAESFRFIRESLEYIRMKVCAVIKEYTHNKNSNSKSEKFYIQDLELQKVLRFLLTLVETQLNPFTLESIESDITNDQFGISPDLVSRILGNIFHWPQFNSTMSDFEMWKKIDLYLHKPLSVFGVVRKEVGDVGGGPVFAKLPGGEMVKICLEMPHVNTEDSEEYFGPKGRATHFNPVLVFFELRSHTFAAESDGKNGKLIDFRQLFDDRLWLLASKEFEGHPVCYHETVLYELIGNSATTNVIFVEVPRTLFNPHKTIFDSLGQDRKSYGFNETLKE